MIYRTRKLIMGADLNGAGTLFGGRALAWIDEEAAVFAVCQLGRSSIVTKFISNIDFKAPAHLGEIVEIGCEVVKFGTTSITVRCAIRNKTTQQEIVVVEKIVFVCVDSEGHPEPHGISNGEQNGNC